MDIFTGTVISIISGPTHRVEKIVTTTEVWLDGRLKSIEHHPSLSECWEVVALVNEEWKEPNQEKTFSHFKTQEDAQVIRPGCTYNC